MMNQTTIAVLLSIPGVTLIVVSIRHWGEFSKVQKAGKAGCAAGRKVVVARILSPKDFRSNQDVACP